ncbi:MAG TPA: adenylate/guanylate cyclase domain-containing protein [Candidatus Rifleibacterium sp.]|nr:adenylate/guanylate cyclase domain-containing protein [Candidatus Rifleibacterium sp.]
MPEKYINIRRRLSLKSLTLAWFTVFAIPAILLQVSLSYLFDLTLNANRQAAVSTLSGEMSSFRRDLQAETFVEKKLARFFAENLRLPYSASATAEQLKKQTGLKVVAVVTHSAAISEVDSTVATHLQKLLPALPRNMLRRYFVAINRRPAIVASQSLSLTGDQRRAAHEADTFFRRQFGLVSEMPLVPGRVSRAVSAKFGGPAFFFYQPMLPVAGQEKTLAAGVLVILRGADLDQRQILAEAAGRQSSGCRRGFSRLNINLAGDHYLTRNIITDYLADAAGQHLVSTFPDTVLVDLVQGGGLVPVNLEKILARLPLLQVTVPMSELQHPLASRASLIFSMGRLLAIIGAVLLLRLYFFGIDFRMRIRAKVLLGTAIMLLLPVALLLAGLTTWNQFNRVYGWYQAEELQRLYFNELYEGFSHYLAALQKHTLRVVASLSRFRGRDFATYERILEKGLENTVASDLFFDLDGGQRLHVRSKKHFRPIAPEEESGRRLIASSILNGFDRHGNFALNQSRGRQRDPGVVDSSFVNEIGNRWGRPYKMARLNTGNRFSTAFVFNDDNYSLHGLLSFNYYDNQLISDYILNHFRPSGKFAGIAARFYEVAREGGSYRLIDLADRQTLQNRNLYEKIALAEDLEGFVWRDHEKNLMQTRWFNDYPLVMVVGSEVLMGGSAAWVLPGMLCGYGLLLMIFVYLVFELIYLRPVREFIRVTGEVGRGNLQVGVQLLASDEFGDLKTVFTGMIQGLEQRRKLVHFVSQEVLTAVASDSDAEMAPGGVRVAATVVFMQLNTDLSPDLVSPETRFAVLGQYIGEADQIVRASGGVIDKVIENTLMLVFRAATAGDQHPLAACRAALELAYVMRDAGYRVRAGIASGNVVSGRIGSRLGKLDYTVIGDTVNLAARLKAEAAKAGTTGIIVAPSTIRGLHGQGRVAFIERVEIKGKSREYPLYELLELR